MEQVVRGHTGIADIGVPRNDLDIDIIYTG